MSEHLDTDNTDTAEQDWYDSMERYDTADDTDTFTFTPLTPAEQAELAAEQWQNVAAVFGFTITTDDTDDDDDRCTLCQAHLDTDDHKRGCGNADPQPIDDDTAERVAMLIAAAIRHDDPETFATRIAMVALGTSDVLVGRTVARLAEVAWKVRRGLWTTEELIHWIDYTYHQQDTQELIAAARQAALPNVGTDYPGTTDVVW